MSYSERLIKFANEKSDDYLFTSQFEQIVNEFFEKEKESVQKVYGNDAFPVGKYTGLGINDVIQRDFRYCCWAEKAGIGSEAFQECLSNAIHAHRKTRILAKKAKKNKE